MEAVAALVGRSKQTLIFVQPGVQQRWEVLLEGGVKPQHFSDRSLALNYAKIWASVNRPSKIQVNGPTGNLEHEWVFR
jgi:hypothetical protein